MGWTQVRIEIVGRRSSHNSPEDEFDRAKWAYLGEKIKELVKQPEFKSLSIEMIDSELDLGG